MGVLGALCATIRDVKCGCCISDRNDEGVVLPYSIAQWDDVETVERVLRLGGVLAPGSSVASVSSVPFGEEGVLSCMAKVSLTYRGTPGPDTIIAKTTPPEFNSRMLARLFRLFSNEINFYRTDMARTLNVEVPEVFFAHYDAKYNRYILAMSDVGRPSADQLIGATAEQACLIMNSLANFHAPHFDRVRQAASMGVAGWVVKLDDDGIDVNDLLAKTFKKGIPFTISELKDPRKWNVPLAEEAEQFLLTLNENFVALQAAAEPPLESNPGVGVHTTIIHGDPRLDNFFFDPCMLIDFQLVREATPETDVAYFLCGGSITTDLRRAHELCLIRLYHELLCAQLPTEVAATYPLHQCVLMYALKQGTVLAQTCTGKFAELSARGERTVALVRAMFERGISACVDWDGAEMLTRALQYLLRITHM